MPESTLNMEILDIQGVPVQVGDRIAAAFREGNRGELRIGTIMGFGERANKVTVVVVWDLESGYGAGPRKIAVKGAIQADLYRFIKINT
jgi:hypothetical protein